MPSNPFSWLGSPPAARYKVGNQSVTWISSLDLPPTPASISPCTKAAALVPPSQRVALFPRRGKLFPPLWTDLVLFLFKSPPLLTSLSDPHCRRWKVSKCCPPVLSLSALLLYCPPISQIDCLPYFFILGYHFVEQCWQGHMVARAVSTFASSKLSYCPFVFLSLVLCVFLLLSYSVFHRLIMFCENTKKS